MDAPFKVYPMIVLFFCVIPILIYRSFLGVDFTDESFHVATAYHFALGAKAFVDELSTGQTYAFLTFPFLKLMVAFSQSTENLVFKMRILFLLFQSILCGACYRALLFSKLFSKNSSILATIFLLFCIPLNMFSLFYVTLGVFYLGLTLNLLYPTQETAQNKFLTSLAGALLGLATIAHPSIFLSSLFIIIFQDKIRLRLGVGLLFSWMLVMILFHFTPMDYLKSIWITREALHSIGPGLGSNRLLNLIPSLLPKGPLFEWYLVWMIAFFFLTRTNRQKLQFSFLLIFPVLVFFNSRARYGGYESAGLLLSLSYTAPLLCYFVFGWSQTKKFLSSYWVPCFLVFVGFSLVSTGGIASTSAGFLPTLPFSLAFLVEALKKANSWKSTWNKRILPTYVFLFFGVLFLRNLLQSAYREPSVRALTHAVSMGPFKGLKTNETKKTFIESLQKDLESLQIKKGRIVFSCLFPAGYLLTDLFPNHDNLWLSPIPESIRVDTDVVVRLFDETYPKLNIWQQHCSPLPEIIAGNKGTIIQKEDYEIWVRNL